MCSPRLLNNFSMTKIVVVGYQSVINLAKSPSFIFLILLNYK
jgi:hypothetical protein